MPWRRIRFAGFGLGIPLFNISTNTTSFVIIRVVNFFDNFDCPAVVVSVNLNISVTFLVFFDNNLKEALEKEYLRLINK